jgi:glycosyltransferase involved in cell wall biosynthesis
VLSGGELAMLNLVQALDGQRWRPAVILGQAGPLASRLEAAGQRVDVVQTPPSLLSRGRFGASRILDPIRILAGIGYGGRLAQHLIRSRAALLHANSLRACVLGSLAARRAGIPSIWHIHSLVAPPMLSTAGVRMLRALANRLPAHVICNSQATAACLGLPSERTTVIPTGVDPVRFTGNGRPRNGRLRIGMVGRFAPWKGQHVFVDAASRLATRYPEAEFVLAGTALFGEESYARSVHERASLAANRDRIRFLDFVDDVPALLRDLDIVVHASIEPEPFGQVVVEAMMAQKPVVASAAGGPLELVEEGVTGRLVQPGDSAALAGALETVIRDPEGAAQMARRARARAVDRYDINKTARQVGQVYERVLARS